MHLIAPLRRTAAARSAYARQRHRLRRPKTASDADSKGSKNTLPKARIETTVGAIDIELFPEQAPVTVQRILELIDDGFYEGLIFHRVVAGFVIQAGGYTKTMDFREAPGPIVNEASNGLSNVKGTLAMARRNDPDSADSQWFINVMDNKRLDARPQQPGYTVFGRVTDGWDVVTAIELTNTVRRNGMAGVPETPIEILRITRLD